MTGRRRPTAVALLVTAVLAVAGCGIDADQEATVAEPGDVPFGLLDPPQRAPSTTAPRSSTADVYLLSTEDGLLAPVSRQLSEGDLVEVVTALLAGPTDAERDGGLSTELDLEMVRSVDLTGGVAAVDLGEGFQQLDAATQRTAIAQLVATLTARPGVGRVSFTLAGEPVEVPRGDGSLVAGSVSRDAYQELIDPD